MYISCRGITKDGVFCQNVDVEMDISRGLFSFLIVGLADKCIGESRERIISAIKNSGFGSPKTKNHKITVSLVPAGIKKEGALLDVPISIAYLCAIETINKKFIENSVFIGELGLDGSIKSNDSLASVVNSIVKENKANGANMLGNSNGAKNISLYSNFKDDQINLINQLKLTNIKIFKVTTLQELVFLLHAKSKEGNTYAPGVDTGVYTGTNTDFDHDTGVVFESNLNSEASVNTEFEIDKVIGQEKAKRAVLISICGNYNLIMSGPPGVGKTMLAKSIHQLLPKPKPSEYLEILSIHNKLERPFRSPHHTSSYSSIIGGGTPITAGEITKAHKGILFLDELPEFNKNIIESLRQPLEQKTIQINRIGDTITLPCDILCVCAMNLCPCGKRGIPEKECVCMGNKINLYRQKISEPFLERFHISIVLPYEKNKRAGQSSHGHKINPSQNLTGKRMYKIIERFDKGSVVFEWKSDDLDFLHKKSEERHFSMRAIDHIKEITETLCLIERVENNQNINSDTNKKLKLLVGSKHLIEAFSYKNELLA